MRGSRKFRHGDGGGGTEKYFSHQRISQRAVRRRVRTSSISKETEQLVIYQGGGGGADLLPPPLPLDLHITHMSCYVPWVSQIYQIFPIKRFGVLNKEFVSLPLTMVLMKNDITNAPFNLNSTYSKFTSTSARTVNSV